MSENVLTANKFTIICRLCGETSSELIKLHARNDGQKIWKKSIREYIGVKITPGDGLPDKICGPCIVKLEDIIDFIEKCQKIQRNLQKILKDNHSLENDEQVDVDQTRPNESPTKVDIEEANIRMTQLLSLLQQTPIKITSLAEPPPMEMAIKTEPPEEFPLIAETLVTPILEEKPESCTETVSLNSFKENDSMQETQDCITARSDELRLNKGKIRKRRKRNVSTYTCPACNKSFTLKKALKLHFDKIHSVDCMEKCPECSKVYRSKYLWKTHILIHSQEKSFQCDNCDKSYTNSVKLRKHKETHIPIEQRYKYDCDVCGKKFTSKNNISIHMKRHTGITPFICDRCGKTYQTKGNLQAHYRTHTGVKPYDCNICGNRYVNEQTFKVHKLKHTGARPHICPHCPKTFQYLYAMKRHILTHTGSRPFPCAYCGKSFRDQWKRKVHERIHTGERPYKCGLCSSAFYESGNLQKHCKNVHNQDYRTMLVDQKEANEMEDYVVSNEEEEKETEETHHEIPNPLLGHSIFSSGIELLRPVELPI